MSDSLSPERIRKAAEEMRQIAAEDRTHDTHTHPKRFKKLVWFTTREEIPTDAKFIGPQRMTPGGEAFLYEVYE